MISLATGICLGSLGGPALGASIEASPPPGTEPAITLRAQSAVVVGGTLRYTIAMGNSGERPIVVRLVQTLPGNLVPDRRPASDAVVRRTRARYLTQLARWRGATSDRARRRAVVEARRRYRLARTGCTNSYAPRRNSLHAGSFLIGPRIVLGPTARRTVICRARAQSPTGTRQLSVALSPPRLVTSNYPEARARVRVIAPGDNVS